MENLKQISAFNKDGIQDWARWHNQNKSKLPKSICTKFFHHPYVSDHMLDLLQDLGRFEVGTVQYLAAVANWDRLIKALGDRSTWGKGPNEKMIKQSSFVSDSIIPETREEVKKEHKKNTAIDRHADAIRKCGAFVDVENRNIAIPENVSLRAASKSLEYLKKKKFTTTRPTFQ